jgi:hypothetical protein
MNYLFFEIEFMLPNASEEIQMNAIGSVYCNHFKYDIFKSVQIASPDYFDLHCDPYRIIYLNDGNLLMACYDRRYLALYDENFKLIKEIIQIDSQSIIPKGLAADSNGNIYLSLKFIQSNVDTILKLNGKFEVLKKLEKNPDKDEYRDLCIYEYKIYACLTDTKRIDVFSLDLKLISKNSLEIHPLQIRTMNGIACVMVDFKSTHFYRLPSFELISTRNIFGPILAYDNFFYVYENDGFNVFDNTGNHIDKIKTQYEMLGYHGSGLTFMKNSLLICMVKKVCKINLNFNSCLS